MGTGLDSPVRPLKFIIGLGAHAGLEKAMRWMKNGDLVSITEAADEAYDTVYDLTAAHREKWAEDPKWLLAIEEAALLAWALVYGWCKTRLANFKDRFEVLQVEEELETPLGADVILQSRLDVLVRERATGDVWVINWKTSASNNEEHLQRDYDNEVQMWTEAIAAQHAIGEPVRGTIIEVLVKGTLRQWRHGTPLLYAYEKPGEPFRVKYTAGWTARRADHLPGFKVDDKVGTLKDWIDNLPSDVLESQFFQLEPIRVNPAVVEDRLASWVYQENATRYVLKNGSEADKRVHFGARDGYWCAECIFKGPCKDGEDLEQMVADGRLVPREDHHKRGA